jgi:hypothetical protein
MHFAGCRKTLVAVQNSGVGMNPTAANAAAGALGAGIKAKFKPQQDGRRRKLMATAEQTQAYTALTSGAQAQADERYSHPSNTANTEDVATVGGAPYCTGECGRAVQARAVLRQCIVSLRSRQ